MALLGATALTGCNSIPDFIAGGSLVTFQQTTAPTSWTKQTTHNNKALRVVSGTASSGGSTAFTSVFTSRTPSGTVNNHTLSVAELASHTHAVHAKHAASVPPGGTGTLCDGNGGSFLGTPDSGGAGSNSGHSHGFSGAAMDFAVQYVDIIICSKN
jgi:hypothetical protein